MKTITEEQFKTVLENADQNEKEILKKAFAGFFESDPYLKACKRLGIEAVPGLADRTNLDLVAADAFYRLTICIRAKNMVNGKLWDYVCDGVQKHWFPRWIKNKAGFGLTRADYDNWAANTTVGERLEYRTEELLREGVIEFNEYYQDLLSA